MTSEPVPPELKKILLRHCFGDFEDCPCDDECEVSEYCAKYHEDTPNNCGLTDSQCYEVQNHEKEQTRKDERDRVLKTLQGRVSKYISDLKESMSCFDEYDRGLIEGKECAFIIIGEWLESLRGGGE